MCQSFYKQTIWERHKVIHYDVSTPAPAAILCAPLLQPTQPTQPNSVYTAGVKVMVKAHQSNQWHDQINVKAAFQLPGRHPSICCRSRHTPL